MRHGITQMSFYGRIWKMPWTEHMNNEEVLHITVTTMKLPLTIRKKY